MCLSKRFAHSHVRAKIVGRSACQMNGSPGVGTPILGHGREVQ